MKRLVLTVSAVGMLMALAIASTNVVSVNVVGYSKADLKPSARILRGMPFNNLSGSENTLLSIFGTNSLTKNDNYALCDRVLMYIPAQLRYQSFAQWTDGVFYLSNTATEWNLAIASNPVVPAGTSFWIVRASDVLSTNRLTFLGEVVDASSQSVSLAAGYQLLSYAFSTDMAMQDINTTGMAANDNYALCDRIVTWEGDRYQFHALWTDGTWYHANDATEWNLAVVSTRVLTMGEGFWFISQGAKNWSESNPYLGNL